MARKNRGGAQRRAESQTVTQANVGQVSAKDLEAKQPQVMTVGDPFKYEPKVARAAEAKTEFDPTWNKRNTKFTPGTKPKGEKSLMGILADMVHQKPGILGSELAVRFRFHAFPNWVRSKYLWKEIDGKKVPVTPAIGWAEGYIDGAVAAGKGYLKMLKEEGTETKPEANGNGEDEDDNGEDDNGDNGESEQQSDKGSEQGRGGDAGESTDTVEGGEAA